MTVATQKKPTKKQLAQRKKCKEGNHDFNEIPFDETVMDGVMGLWFKAMRCSGCGKRVTVKKPDEQYGVKP